MLAWSQLFLNCWLFLWLMLQVQKEFHISGFMTDVDLDPGCTLNKKIRNAQLAQYNFILGQCRHTLFTPLVYRFLSVSLVSLSPRPTRYWFFLSSLLVFSAREKWWERRRRRATPWMFALGITKSMVSVLWRSASSAWNSSRAPRAETQKRTSELCQACWYQLLRVW